jgi:RimJ/RimL family protein N-acetyltransferase
MSEIVQGEGVRLRRASPADVGYLVTLGQDADVVGTLAAVSPWDEEAVRAAVDAASADPTAQGRYVLEVDRGGTWVPAGGVAFALQNRRSRIAYLFGLMVEPAFRGRGLGGWAARELAVHLIREVGFHRVQLEVYGFNEAALRLFDQAGFVREGARRKAYWRHDAWNDGVMFALVEEDLP